MIHENLNAYSFTSIKHNDSSTHRLHLAGLVESQDNSDAAQASEPC
jgi:hypothetical protein